MRKLTSLFIAGLTAAVLGACSQAPTLTDQAGDTARIVAISRADTRDGTESRYGGHVVVWRPDAGFAVLEASSAADATFSTLSTGSEPNDSISTPEKQAVESQGYNVWSGGYNVWSGGWTVWSGGWTVWSGGEGSSLTPTENHPIWRQINLFDAHEIAGSLGAGVKVAVIDTGIDVQHPIFQGHLAPEIERYDFVDGDDTPQEVPAPEGSYSDYGHGTGVAGIIRQVAPEAIILPIRALEPDGSGDVTDVAAAIDWAIRNDADIINLSLGTRTHSPTLTRMIELATSKGIYVVSSAGNTDNQKVTYPAARSTKKGVAGALSLGVGSIEIDGSKSEYSTYGKKLELLAPGTGIYTSAPDERLAAWTGTSMSTAIVSGALALALGETPNAEDLAERLATSAVSVDGLNPDYRKKLGHGLVNLAAFLQTIQ